MSSFTLRSTLFPLITYLFLLLGTAKAQDGITVTVYGEGETLIGVNVSWYDDTDGTVTDYEGKAIIKRLNAQEKVTFRYTGFQTKVITYEDLANNSKYPNGFIKLEVAENLIGGEGVIVIARGEGRLGERVNSNLANIIMIDKQVLEDKSVSTSADGLEKGGEVFVQRSQAGGGSPIIRGFEANKVLIVVDGVRMNNAIFRSGHLQNVLTVDNAMLERMEVFQGPSAVIYGSDALGGVLYMESKAPLFAKYGEGNGSSDTTEVNLYSRYSTVNSGLSTHLDIGAGNRKFASITSMTFNRFGDIRSGTKAPSWDGDSIPSNWLRNQYVGIVNNDDLVIDSQFSDVDPYLQTGTDYNQSSRIGYWQIDFLQKFGYRPNLNRNHTFNFQFSTSNDIQRYDQLSQLSNNKPKFAEWYYGPQKRLMFSHSAMILKEKGRFFDKAQFITSFQNIAEDRYQRKLNKILLERNLVDVYVYALNMDFKKSLNEKETQTLFYGAELTRNKVISEADFINVLTKETLGGNPSRYGNASNFMTTAAGYLNYRTDIKRKDEKGEFDANSPTLFRFLAGLRYTFASTIANYEITSYAPEIPYERVGVMKGNPTGAIGLTFTPKDWAFKASFSTGFRVPNVDDLAKFREKDGFVTIPNPDLKAEYGLNYEFNMARTFRFGELNEKGKKSSSITASGSIFLTKLSNALVRKLHHLPDRDTIINDVLVNIPGDSTYFFDGAIADVVINTNAAKATIMGYSLNLKADFNNKLFINASYNDIKGNYTSGIIDDEIVTEEVPLSHIPPSYGQFSLAYQFNGKNKKWKRFRTELSYRFNGIKPLREYDPSSGNSDNLDDAIQDYGTPKWATWNIYNSWQFSRNFGLNFNVENILDLHYRPFSSGISAPGRNFVITLRGNF